jgi:hypothetical protein
VLAKESDSVVPWPLVGGRVMFGVWQCAGSASHVAQHHAAPPPSTGAQASGGTAAVGSMLVVR